mgnify:CR=1 FL=1
MENFNLDVISELQLLPLKSKDKFFEDISSKISSKTKVLFLSHITSPTGLVFPIKDIIDFANERKIITIVGNIFLEIKSMIKNLFIVFALAGLGLPGTSGFLGEFLVLTGTFQKNYLVAMLATFGVVLGAAYMLWLTKRVIFGVTKNDQIKNLKDVLKSKYPVVTFSNKMRKFDKRIKNKAIKKIIKSILKKQRPLTKEIRIGQLKKMFFTVNGKVLQDQKSKPVGCLIVMTDVTRLKQLEAMRRVFVANVSHELKTPITSIGGYIETAQGDIPLKTKAVKDDFLFLTKNKY